jgi:hypothetical protein
VILGEVARFPAHPRAVAFGLLQVLREMPAILRLRRDLAPDGGLLDAMLEDTL